MEPIGHGIGNLPKEIRIEQEQKEALNPNFGEWKGVSLQQNSLNQIQESMHANKLQLEMDAVIEAKTPTYEEIKLVQRKITSFSQKLMLKLSEDSKQSICISPINLFPVLAMILKGLPHGEAKKQMLSVLGFEKMEEGRFLAALGAILKDISSEYEGKLEVKIANGLALNGEANPFFIKTIKEIFDGEVFNVQGNKTQTINQWFYEKTKGKVKDIIPPSYDSGLGVGMLSAIFFLALFRHQFSPSSSFESEFKCIDGTTPMVMMMYQKNNFSLYSDNDLMLIEMPYESPVGKSLSQIIILPKKENNLNNVLKKISSSLRDIRLMAEHKEVKVYLPRLEINYEVELLPILKEMGCPLDCCLANISPADRLSLVKQKINLSNDEKGTQGGAGTAGLTSRGDMTPVFRADHPFVLLIMQEDEMLFQTTVVDSAFLVTSQKAKELEQSKDQELIDQVKTNLLSENDALKFLKDNSDIQLVLDRLPSGIDRFVPNEVKIQTTPSGTKFDIVNYSSLDVGFDGKRVLRFNKQLAINGKNCLGFTEDNCQLVIFEKDYQYILLAKDIGSKDCESYSIKKWTDNQYKFYPIKY